MDNFISEYVSEQLSLFNSTNLCCVNWLGPFFDMGELFNSKITELNFKSKIHVINGQKVKKIYKIYCSHCMERPRPFQLTDKSIQHILFHLKNSMMDEVHLDVLPVSIYKPMRLIPTLPANRFTIGPLRQNTYHSDIVFKEMVQQSWRMNCFKQTVLKNIGCNRIVVINGDASLRKSTAIPLCIVEDSVIQKTYCKILCVESDNLSAITHSTVLANHLEERIGSRVGFQVHLQSRVCDNTNIIYTTALFFLRVLMGQDSKESFRHISHVVVSDVHLHQAYKDIFLKELKNMLPHYPHIKIILLSNSNDNRNLLSYFNEGLELQLNTTLNEITILHMEDVFELMQKNQLTSKPMTVNVLPLIESHYIVSRHYADMALEYYKASGSEMAFKNFLYFVKSENISINYAHSKEGYTLLIEAVKQNKYLHVNWLLTYENANPFYEDGSKINALEYAISANSDDCINALMYNIALNEYEIKPPPINFDLIMDLIQLITSKWETGNILVFLPTFEDLLKLNYIILKTQFIGKIPQAIEILLLHLSMQPEQLQQIISNQVKSKIILATDLAESLEYLNDITYVVDSGQVCREKYRLQFKCNECVLEWISKECLQRRAAIAGRYTAGHYFSLVPKGVANRLPLLCTPELLYIPMNRVALTVKFLNPCVMVAEYLRNTIFPSPPEHVAESVEFLKVIEIFDSNEEITWLGCRLIDVPINLEHGKSLVFSILFKCLDPVLTIISFLTYSNNEKGAYKHSVFNHSQRNSTLFSKDSYSDHLELLRIYQVWQDEKKTKTNNDIFGDEQAFVLNGILENICEIRTNLVGALRSSQLIHNQGHLSMHSINSKSNNWAAIKASIAGGFYPKFCIIEQTEKTLDGNIPKLFIHSNSSLHHSKVKEVESLPSDWIVYCREDKSILTTNISTCTLINQISVALFAGKIEMDANNVVFENDFAGFFINENMWLPTNARSAVLLYKLRQIIYVTFMDYLQTCASNEKWKSTNSVEVPCIFDLISKLLLNEDLCAGFSQPNRVGNRPKAIANKFASDLIVASASKYSNLPKKEVLSVLLCPDNRFLEKEFFLVNTFDNNPIFGTLLKQSVIDLSKNSNFKIIQDNVSSKKLVYLIICNCSRKRITTIGLVSCSNGTFLLHFRFEVNIPIHDVIISCAALKHSLPSFRPNRIPQKLENNVGEIILELM